LQRLDGFGLAMIEQPFPADALLAHADLARRLSTPICLDDTIVSAQAASDAIALKACRVICIKPGRVGGYLEAVRIHDVCHDAGIPVWVGGMLETGIARAANLALAALPGFTIPGDLSASTRWFERDITDALTMQGGRMRVPKGPGIGVDIDMDALDALTVAKEWVNACARGGGGGGCSRSAPVVQRSVRDRGGRVDLRGRQLARPAAARHPRAPSERGGNRVGPRPHQELADLDRLASDCRRSAGAFRARRATG
jgi:hypothetical protein